MQSATCIVLPIILDVMYIEYEICGARTSSYKVLHSLLCAEHPSKEHYQASCRRQEGGCNYNFLRLGILRVMKLSSVLMFNIIECTCKRLLIPAQQPKMANCRVVYAFTCILVSNLSSQLNIKCLLDETSSSFISSANGLKGQCDGRHSSIIVLLWEISYCFRLVAVLLI